MIEDLLREFYYPSTSVSETDLQLQSALRHRLAGATYLLMFTTTSTLQPCRLMFFVREWTDTWNILEDTCETLFPVTGKS